MKKPIIFGLIAIIVLAAGGAWYYFSGPCGINKVNAANTEFQNILQKWMDAEQIASSTPRMALASQITNMQDIRRKAEDLEVPACMNTAKGHLVSAMNSSIEGYVSFLGQKDENLVSISFDTAKTYISNYSQALLEVKKCAPFCK